MNEFLTLRKMLIELKSRVDERFADLIEGASSMKSVDRLEEQAGQLLDRIDSVINLAENYMPEAVDAELVKEVVITAEAAEKLLFRK